ASTPLVTSLRPGVPEALAALVQHCLEKEPAKRCRSAEALLAELRAIETAAASTLAPVRRLAVLPLTHSGMDPEDACLADGATEDLIGRLSSLSGLRVTARTSTLSFGSTDGSIAGAARELGVETLLQGSVVRWQQEVQVTLRLVDVANEHTFWTTTQQVPQDELAGTLRTLAWQVAGELDVKVHMGERRNVAKHGTDDPHAYASYIKGRYLWNKRDRESLQQARGCFEHALDLDPSFAAAWTALADTFLVLGRPSALPPAEAYPRARAAAERALAIDDELAEAHASLATSLADHYWDWATAEKHYRRAIELNPSY